MRHATISNGPLGTSSEEVERQEAPQHVRGEGEDEPRAAAVRRVRGVDGAWDRAGHRFRATPAQSPSGAVAVGGEDDEGPDAEASGPLG